MTVEQYFIGSLASAGSVGATPHPPMYLRECACACLCECVRVCACLCECVRARAPTLWRACASVRDGCVWASARECVGDLGVRVRVRARVRVCAGVCVWERVVSRSFAFAYFVTKSAGDEAASHVHL